ncbi:hypothetical protein BV898_06983 [Hypsibius exemplaris]|uniref:Secreted protein n=1 Tax=Hypsibius exemplaris TaxID=2072580 RepID=A0A1W0WUV1_HYPEX|nr:hypothetical protein BV898_06983 [Hypsibius exemplaris]
MRWRNLPSSVVAFMFLTGLHCNSQEDVFTAPEDYSKSNCNPDKELVCVPTACSITICPHYRNAKCEAIRCGCEARFVNWVIGKNRNVDVTELCSPKGPVVVPADQINQHSRMRSDTELQFLQLFEGMNVIVTSYLKQIGLQLYETNRDVLNEADVERISYIVWSIELRAKLAKLTFIEDASDDSNVIEAQSMGRELIKGISKTTVEHLSDDAQNTAADLEVTSFLDRFLATATATAKVLRNVLFRENGVTPSIIGTLYVIDCLILEDLFKIGGTFFDIIQSGKLPVFETKENVAALRTALAKDQFTFN